MDDEENLFTCEQLYNLRRAARYTQINLAVEIGISREMLGKYETDTHANSQIKLEVAVKWFKLCKKKIAKDKRPAYIKYITDLFGIDG